jgi:hypothetical protein
MHAQHGRNYAFFDAPVGMIFTIDRVMEQGSWLDYGMFLENIMVAARARGLAHRRHPGDGIGKEVMPEGVRVLDAAARRFGFELEARRLRLGQLRLLREARRDDAGRLEGPLGGHDAIFFGAVGWPATVPDHVSLWGSLLKFRREFDQYVNLRPAG